MINMNQEMIETLKENNFTEEQIDFIDENIIKQINRRNNYKIRCERPVTLYKQSYNGNDFYKIICSKSDSNGNLITGYKRVSFAGCQPPNVEKCEIIIHNMFETFFYKSDDKYNAIFSLVILEYDYVRNEAREKFEAIGDYYDSKTDENYDNFNFGNPVNEIDDELPF